MGIFKNVQYKTRTEKEEKMIDFVYLYLILLIKLRTKPEEKETSGQNIDLAKIKIYARASKLV